MKQSTTPSAARHCGALDLRAFDAGCLEVKRVGYNSHDRGGDECRAAEGPERLRGSWFVAIEP
jgi:hypothetical protein